MLSDVEKGKKIDVKEIGPSANTSIRIKFPRVGQVSSQSCDVTNKL